MLIQGKKKSDFQDGVQYEKKTMQARTRFNSNEQWERLIFTSVIQSFALQTSGVLRNVFM